MNIYSMTGRKAFYTALIDFFWLALSVFIDGFLRLEV